MLDKKIDYRIDSFYAVFVYKKTMAVGVIVFFCQLKV